MQEAGFGMTQHAMEREQHGRFQGDENLYVTFYVGAIEDRAKSIEEGRPIFRDAEMIRIMIPGDKGNIVEREVRDLDKRRFARHYEAWKVDNQELLEGTPLDKWPYVTPSQVEEMKYFGIRTVEQLANIGDAAAQNVGPIQSLKQRAKEYIEVTAAEAPLAQLQEELSERDAKLEEQSSLIEDLQARLAKLEEDDD